MTAFEGDPMRLYVMRVVACLVSFGLVTALAGAASAAGQPPRRIVSFNLCADQLAVALADPRQIAGLSPYAGDPLLSVVAEKARAFPRLDWGAESTVALGPDLVLVGPNDRSATRRMLSGFGLRVVEVALVSDLQSARAQIEQFAALVGHSERGARMAAALDAARQRLARAPRPQASTALMIERGGYTQGPDSLAAALIAAAGLRPPAGAPAGYGGYLPLEQLIMLRPDLLVLKDAPREPTDQGALFLTHPALQVLYPPSRRVALPTRYTLCGGPALIEALDYLADFMTRLAAK
jgi:iron complex transport system substrate-binding protein